MGIIVTSTPLSFNVDFNGIATPDSDLEGSWTKNAVTFKRRSTYIKVIIIGQPSWDISHDGNGGTVQVDSVNGLGAPFLTLADLYTQLVALKG